MTTFRLIFVVLISLVASGVTQAQTDQALKAVVSEGKLFLCDSKGNLVISSLEPAKPSSVVRVDADNGNPNIPILWDITSDWFYITGSSSKWGPITRCVFKIPISQLDTKKFLNGEVVSASKISFNTIPTTVLDSVELFSDRSGYEVYADLHATQDLLYVWIQQGNYVTQWIAPPTSAISDVMKTKEGYLQTTWGFPFVAFPSGSAVKVIPAFRDAFTVAQAEFVVPTGVRFLEPLKDDHASRGPGFVVLIVDKTTGVPRWLKARVTKNSIDFTSQEGKAKATKLEEPLKRALSALEKVNPIGMNELKEGPTIADPVPQAPEKAVPEKAQSDLETNPVTVFRKDDPRSIGAGLFVRRQRVPDSSLLEDSRRSLPAGTTLKPNHRADTYVFQSFTWSDDKDWDHKDLWWHQVDSNDHTPLLFEVYDAIYDAKSDSLVTVFREGDVLRANIVRLGEQGKRVGLGWEHTKLNLLNSGAFMKESTSAKIEGSLLDGSLRLRLNSSKTNGKQIVFTFRNGDWVQIPNA